MRIVGCALGLLLAACFGPSNAGYDQVGIIAEQLSTDGDVVEATNHCFTLPLLLGSRIEQTFEIAPGFSLIASGTRDAVEFSGTGAAHDGSVSFTFEDFEGTWSEVFEVTGTDNSTYQVTLRNGCVYSE